MVTKSGAHPDRMTSHDWSIWLPPARTLWSPKQAACLLLGYKPSAFLRHADAVALRDNMEDVWVFLPGFRALYPGPGKTRMRPHELVRWYDDHFSHVWRWEASDPKHLKWPTRVKIPGPWLPKPLLALVAGEPSMARIRAMEDAPRGKHPKPGNTERNAERAVWSQLAALSAICRYPKEFRNQKGRLVAAWIAAKVTQDIQDGKIWRGKARDILKKGPMADLLSDCFHLHERRPRSKSLRLSRSRTVQRELLLRSVLWCVDKFSDRCIKGGNAVPQNISDLMKRHYTEIWPNGEYDRGSDLDELTQIHGFRKEIAKTSEPE